MPLKLWQGMLRYSDSSGEIKTEACERISPYVVYYLGRRSLCFDYGLLNEYIGKKEGEVLAFKTIFM